MTQSTKTAGKGNQVKLTAVNKQFGAVQAVRNVNLTIEAGEFMTFLGPSGSGKTTTLNLIAGFADTTSGEILIGNRPMQSVPAYQRNLGVVFQSYALFPHMNVWENIAFPLQQRAKSKAEQHELITRVLELVELKKFENRLPTELSGGQQQRVALARALVFNPSVLLLDEPLGALDKKLREGLQSELKRIHNSLGSTFIFVTHDQEEALSMSDRIAIFNKGQIEQVGTGQDLYERPETLFVGKFLGDSTILHGRRLQDSGDSSALSVSGETLLAPLGARKSSDVLLLRPEKLRLLPAGSPVPPEHNRLQVQVTDRTYLGSSWRYEVVFGSEKGIVRAQPEESLIEQGAVADLVWHRSNGVLLEPEPPSAV